MNAEIKTIKGSERVVVTSLDIAETLEKSTNKCCETFEKSNAVRNLVGTISHRPHT